jgi:SAM-dependent methyltransferase
VADAYVGLDYSVSMVDLARRRHPGVDIRLLDASDLSSFARDTFDVAVFSFNGLDYLFPYDKRRACLTELGRVLRADATLIISAHNSRAFVRPRPIASGQGALKTRAIQVYASWSAARSTLPSRAFWNGSGYQTDRASGLVNFAATPAKIRDELAGHGWTLVRTVGSRFPTRLPMWMEPWYYYVFRREAS